MKKVLSVKPPRYLEQGFSGCGGYSANAILGAYGKDDRADPLSYYPGGIGIASSPKRWDRILSSYGLDVERLNTRNVFDKAALLKEKLDQDKVVMLHIGNGYAKSGRWYSIGWQLISHWITVWGYDDVEQVFYIYDSYVPLKNYSKGIPAGNIKRSYSDVVRDWGGGFPWWWRYDYLTITNK